MSLSTVIVTGASKGIGYAVVEYLLSQSTNVVAVARSQGHLSSLRSKKNLEILLGDVSEQTTPAKAVKIAIDKFGGLNGLVLNAAILDACFKIVDADIEAWKTLYNVNVFSLVAFAKEAIPELRKSLGRIVIVSSGSSVRAYQAMGAYGSSKAAANHLAQTLALEEKDITTIALRPGVVDTNMQKAIREDHKSQMSQADTHKFQSLYASGEILSPDKPAKVIAEAVLTIESSLSGKFLSWDGQELRNLGNRDSS